MKLGYHNSVIHLLLTAAGKYVYVYFPVTTDAWDLANRELPSSSLERLETSTMKIERRLSSIRELIDKSQAAHGQPTLSGPAIKTENNLVKFELSSILMKHAEAFTSWKAIGINDWINAGRWWLLKVSEALKEIYFLVLEDYILTSPNMKQYQLQMQSKPAGKSNMISNIAYTYLIKASWILSDVISKHPQLNLLETAVQYDVQALAEVRLPAPSYFIGSG